MSLGQCKRGGLVYHIHIAGFPSHNIHTNPNKTQLSFALEHAGIKLARQVHLAAEGSEWVKWCGLLVNVINLEIQADYTRYTNRPLSDALTLPLSQVTCSGLVTDTLILVFRVLWPSLVSHHELG